jgi:hypothetical protein
MTDGFRAGIMAAAISLLAMIGTIGVAVAQAPDPLPGGAPRSSSVGQGANATPAVQLTPAQKSAIYDAVSRERSKITPPPNFRASVGAEVPGSIELYTLPPEAVANAQAASNYRYTMVNNEVVLVDPLNLKVVDIIRR